MDCLRFCHQFFEFNLFQWKAYWRGREPALRDAEEAFRLNPWPRRVLRTGNFPTFSLAMRECERILRREEANGIRWVTAGSPDFPPALLEYIPPERHPALLYVRGVNPPAEKDSVAIVGTRYPSRSGKENAASFAAYFSAIGLRVVSGLAKGIDTIAHRENIELGTVAVLGSGLREIYPAENEALAERILANGGCLVSPFPLEQVPLPRNFPQRNEWIAALSTGAVVVEAAERSGALVTGKQSLSMGKAVAALPQDFRSPFGRGAIQLQQAGAIPVASEEEALAALYCRWGGFALQEPLPAFQRPGRSFSLADFQKAVAAGLPESVVLLEEAILSGRIERIGADRYRLRPNMPPSDAKQ